MHYAAFVRSYYRWYNRMFTGAGQADYAPGLFLSALQALNLMCVSLVLLPASTPTWGIMTGAGLVLLVMYWRNQTIINGLGEAPRFSRWTDNVPGLREFSAVYAYLALTLGLFFLPLFVRASG